MSHQPILEGIKILDFTQAISGPSCSMLLSDWGANVLKVEEPKKGDSFRRTQSFFLSFNRNKRSLTVNLKSEKGVEILKNLIAQEQFDVIIENFKPGTMAKMGFSYDEVKKLNPKIIYCSISGFGQTGPYRDRGGWDSIIFAMSGIMAATGYPDRPPVRAGTSFIDLTSGLFAAFAILLALRKRDTSGSGEFIDISLFDVGIFLMSHFIAEYSISGKLPVRQGSRFMQMGAPYDLLQASDGSLFVTITNDEDWKLFCEVLDLSDLARNPLFLYSTGRKENYEILLDELKKKLAYMKTNEILEKLLEAQIPCGPLNTLDAAIRDPQLTSRGSIFDVGVDGKTVKIADNPVRFANHPRRHELAPRLGDSTRYVLTKLGYSSQEYEMLKKEGIV